MLGLVYRYTNYVRLFTDTQGFFYVPIKKFPGDAASTPAAHPDDRLRTASAGVGQVSRRHVQVLPAGWDPTQDEPPRGSRVAEVAKPTEAGRQAQERRFDDPNRLNGGFGGSRLVWRDACPSSASHLTERRSEPRSQRCPSLRRSSAHRASKLVSGAGQRQYGSAQRYTTWHRQLHTSMRRRSQFRTGPGRWSGSRHNAAIGSRSRDGAADAG